MSDPPTSAVLEGELDIPSMKYEGEVLYRRGIRCEEQPDGTAGAFERNTVVLTNVAVSFALPNAVDFRKLLFLASLSLSRLQES